VSGKLSGKTAVITGAADGKATAGPADVTSEDQVRRS